ncbi:MAG: hypothetical protein GC192_21020 [Bacteroidetes bacterium]|nr:hypothetical protein [Bacteroidota bacterium]
MSILDKFSHLFSFSKPKKLAGVDVFSAEGSYAFHAIVLEKRKDEVLVQSKILHANEIKDLYGIIGDDVEIHLSVNIRGVLYKQLPAQQDESRLFQMALPNADTADFYWRKEPIQTGFAVSIVRKNIIDELLEQFRQVNLWVTGISLGPFNIRHIYPFLPQGTTVAVHDFYLNFDSDGSLIGFIKKSNEQNLFSDTKIGDEYIDERFISAYATAFKGILDKPGGMDIPALKVNAEAFFHKMLLKKVGLKILIGLLAVLLVNSVLYYHIKHKDEMAKILLSKKLAELAILDSLEKEYKEQEDLIRLTQVNKPTKSSFFADQIAASIPSGIKLLTMEIFPLKGNKTDYEPGAVFQYEANTILLKGQCENSLKYNEWLKYLEKFSWSSRVEHLTYKEVGTSQKEFELKIIIADSSK